MNLSLIADRYRPQQLLGEVNHSQFYEGFDERAQSRILIRLIDLDQENRKFRHKLEGFMKNEFQVVAELVHPNVLRTLDYGLVDNTYYQINEYIPFITLHQFLLENRSLDRETILRLALEIADTVAYFHRINIIHCDLKPDNILLHHNRIKLMEFSIANHSLEGNMVTGTPPYMSPEAAMGEPPAPSRDIWALGITLFEMLSGQLPFQVEGRMNDPAAMPELLSQIVRAPVPSIESLVPNLSPRLVALLNWMLEKEVAQRIGSMRQVAAELENILSDPQQPKASLAVGEVIQGRYRLQSVIGEGGFGQVFVGADLKTGSKIAVKMLKSELAQQPSQLARFKREAEILSRLKHPGIIQVLDTVELRTDHYMIMPYIEGGDLRHLLNDGAIPFQKALQIGAAIADALDAVHAMDIIHRDIKPENVVMTADGLPRLTDFGIAYVQNATRLTDSQSLIGTFQYMAPEILMNGSASRASDIWSLGVLLYEMLTGNQPFVRITVANIILAILNDPLPNPRDACKDCTDPIADLIAKMLVRNPAERLSSAREVADVLKKSLSIDDA